MQTNGDALKLAELGGGCVVSAEQDAVRVSNWPSVSPETTPASRLAHQLQAAAAQMLESGLASEDGGDLLIRYDDFVELDKQEIDVFEGLAPPSPFALTLESSGWLGSANFRYRYDFYLGRRVVHLKRMGCFVEQESKIYRLDNSTFALLQTIDNFNAAPAEAKTGRDAFVSFAKVQGLSAGIGMQLDRFISRERVLIASQVGLDLLVEADGRISFAPKVEGAPDDALRQAFFAADDAEAMYSLDDGAGGRVRVILDDEQREVLRRMQRVRHLGGADSAKVLRNPHAVFDGVSNHVDIDLDQFGSRVKGIGDFPFAVQPYVRITSESIFDAAGPDARSSQQWQPTEAGLECTDIDGSKSTVTFASAAEAEAFREKARAAWLRGDGVIEYQGKSIALNQTLVRALDEQHAALTPHADDVKPRERRYLLIHTNEAEMDYSAAEPAETQASRACELPEALRSDRLLKPHQKDGLAWLQLSYQMGRTGCLLADDMGLGKTLQVLSFLAWLIEHGKLSQSGENSEKGPWDPILVVMPLVLLEAEVWQRDMREFFANEGSIFQPWLVLRGPALNRLRRIEAPKQSETISGAPHLDVDELRQHRVIFTNYETVTNYQFSLAQRDLNWSAVVTDEAQEYKTPNTKISHALKALTAQFRVACTGTPVETRLRDVWNLFDFLQPGGPLSSVTAFTREFEEPYQETGGATAAQALDGLRERFRIGHGDAWIMRRDKRGSLPGLPRKEEHELRTQLSDEQRRMHLEIMQAVKTQARPLELLHRLTDIYQHPALRPHYDGIPAEEAIARCPKLAAVIDCLSNIQKRGEKALIFVRRKPMQRLLKDVLDKHFSLSVDIINGDTGAQVHRAGSNANRRQILERFRAQPGFAVLVLSPVVAGLGLTLVEANHVIHYGRWWNPALEAQATDRVHRIGQTKPVHVYYPIAVDPLKQFTSFDEKLDRIIRRRRQMADDFLTPLPVEEEMEKELLEDVMS